MATASSLCVWAKLERAGCDKGLRVHTHPSKPRKARARDTNVHPRLLLPMPVAYSVDNREPPGVFRYEVHKPRGGPGGNAGLLQGIHEVDPQYHKQELEAASLRGETAAD